MKPLFKVVLVSFITVGFSLVQAAILLGGTIAGASAKDVDDFWAVDDIIMKSLPLIPFVVLIFILFAARIKKSSLWMMPVLLSLALYWSFIIDKPIFEDRGAAWSTWTAKELQDHVTLFFFIPSTIIAAIFGWILRKMIIQETKSQIE